MAGTLTLGSRSGAVTRRADKVRVVLVVEGETIEQLRLVFDTLSTVDLARFELHLVYSPSSHGDALADCLRAAEKRGIATTSLEVSDLHRAAVGLGAVMRLASLLRLTKCEILHMHGLRAGVLGHLAGELSGKKKAPVYVQGMANCKRGQRYLYLARLASRFTDAILTGSNAEREFVIRHQIAPEKRALRLSAGIDISLYDGYLAEDDFREELGVPANSLLVAAASLSSLPDEPEMFLSVAARVLRDHPNCHFIWVGNGALREDVELRAKALGLDQRLHFAPYTADLRPVLSQMDVFVVTSTAATFGYVTCEAMALGVPVVAARASGSEEVVAPGRTGYLVPPGEAETFAMAIHLLLSDSALRLRLGRAGKRRAIEEFDLSRMTSQLEELYLSLLAERGEQTCSRDAGD